MSASHWVGLAKFYVERLHGYAGKVQFFMVCWLFFQTVPWTPLYIVGAILGVPLLLWLDIRYIAPAEYDTSARLNPLWQETLRRMERLTRP